MGKLLMYLFLSPFYLIGAILKPGKLLGSIGQKIGAFLFMWDVDKFLRKKK